MTLLSRFRFRGVMAICCTVVLLSPLSVKADKEVAGGKARGEILILGKVSTNPKKHHRYFRPMADYVARHMKDLGIKEVKILLARDNPQMVRYLKQGKIDWISETPFSAVFFKEKAGGEMLLRRWKKGVPDYHTVFVVRKDGGIRSLEDLKGKTIALEDPGSSTAFLVPVWVLLKEGLGIIALESPREPPPPNLVGYVFAKQEINMSTWLHKKLVSGLAYSNLDWVKKDHTPLAFRQDFKIIHKSRPIPRGIEMVRKGMRPELKARLKKILLNAHMDPEAAHALHMMQRTTLFDELDSSVLARLEEIRKMQRTVLGEGR